jgi:glycosyltransferase involved in cell wall biosynthesis
MLLYLTYNDQPSGVYWSQVTDVVEHLNTLGGRKGLPSDQRMKLVALVSLRGYWSTRQAILQRMPDALVLPMVPRAHNWRINWIWVWLVCRWYRPSGIVGRGVFATALALRMRRHRLVQRVCLDGRGAYGAEWEEYRIVDDDRLIEECARVERSAVLEADLRIAVSEALVDHWRERFGYTGTYHVVIPCTLGRELESPGGQVKEAKDLRRELGWSAEHLVLVYSGSTVGWQSLGLLARVLTGLMASDPRVCVLFLTGEDGHITELEQRFPGRVARRWLRHGEVHAALEVCDHGLLIREPSVTNRVASPTKFAEYLSAGLPVLISEDLGDVAAFVQREQLGLVWKGEELSGLSAPSEELRERARRAAKRHFTKTAFAEAYRHLLRCMGPARMARNGARVKPTGPVHGLVSIIVPSYNKGRYVEEMVASVQAQSHRNWEMLFIDDGSTDGTRDILLRSAGADERIKLHFQDGNRGANHCRNLGIQLAAGEHVMFLDADDVLAPHCLQSRLDADPEGTCDLVVSTMEVFRGRPGEGGNRWVPSARDPLGEFLRHNLPWSVMQPLWRRSFLLSLGGFDETFSRHQDVEFHTRALFHPCVRYLTMAGDPDCYYRIAEERKVLRPFALLDGFTTSALQYYRKFLHRARASGMHRLLIGIIYQTHVQLLHNRKLGLITQAEFSQLYRRLLAPDILRDMGLPKRLLLHLSGTYHALPIRIPGVNRMLYWLMTR